MTARSLENTLLHHPELELEYLFQVLGAQCAKDYDLVDAVDELRRELPARSLYCGAVDLVVKLGIHLRWLLRETHGATDKLVHLVRSKVRSHHNYALREIDTAIVTERERRLVENSE